MGNTQDTQREPILIYCPFCDESDHTAKECEYLKRYSDMQNTLKLITSSLNRALWKLDGKLIEKISLGNKSYIFWLEEYLDQPFYYFSSDLMTIDHFVGKNISVYIYPIHDMKPHQMLEFYVHSIKK